MKKFFFSSVNNTFGVVVFLLSLSISFFIYHQFLGHPNNFISTDSSAVPMEGNFLALMYRSGPIIVLQLTLLFILMSYIIERLIAIHFAKGVLKFKAFASRVTSMVTSSRIDEIITIAEYQKGTVGNVLLMGVGQYQKSVEKKHLSPEEKAELMQHELEAASKVELPLLKRNMIIISTLASISILLGLFGTINGIIQNFSTYASLGSPDTFHIVQGVSQALITTAIGIITAAIAIVFYNYHSNTIESLSYSIDELSYRFQNQLKSLSYKESKEIEHSYPSLARLQEA